MNIMPFNIWVLLGTLVAVLSFIFLPYVRNVAEWFVTIIHEAGHGVFSLLTGNGISGIKLHRDGSGSTTTTHYRNIFSKLFRVIVLFAGYSAPIYLGITVIVLNIMGFYLAAFYVLLAIGLLTLIFLRNLFGIIILGLYFLALGIGVAVFNGQWLPVLVNFFGFLFLIKGIMDIVKITKPVFTMKANDMQTMSDFHILQNESLFHIPAQAWYVIFVLTNVTIITVIVAWFVTNLMSSV